MLTPLITVLRDGRKVETLKGTVIPRDIEIAITRHYGNTAAEKSNELLFHMGIAVVSVSLLIAFILGFRESLIVFVAIPVTLAEKAITAWTPRTRLGEYPERIMTSIRSIAVQASAIT